MQEYKSLPILINVKTGEKRNEMLILTKERFEFLQESLRLGIKVELYLRGRAVEDGKIELQGAYFKPSEGYQEEEQSRPLTEVEKARIVWEHKYKHKAPEHWQPKHYRAATKLLEKGIIYYNTAAIEFKIDRSVRWGDIEQHIRDLRLLDLL